MFSLVVLWRFSRCEELFDRDVVFNQDVPNLI